jgi:hypothetical protein
MGEVIYVGPSDDLCGGKATINLIEDGISGGEPTMYVGVRQAPGHKWNWEFLAREQKKLAVEYKEQWARSDHFQEPRHGFLDPLATPAVTPDIQAQWPGFLVICQQCGSTDVTLNNHIGPDPESTTTIEVALACNNCSNSTRLAAGE